MGKQGLCYYCDEWFTPGHKCKSKQLYLLIEEGNDIDTTGDPNTIEKEGGLEPGVEILEHALTGKVVHHTIKIKGVKKNLITFLIDTGSTHIFWMLMLQLNRVFCATYNSPHGFGSQWK